MNCTVLVVDDELSACREMRKFLEGKGCSVVEAYDGRQALEAYRAVRPDVVLLDMLMPCVSGLVTLREIKAIDPEANVIMVTAVYEESLAKDAMAQGAFDYITKPIDRNYLEMVIMTKVALLGVLEAC